MKIPGLVDEGTFRSLHVAAYRWFWLGTLTSFGALQMQLVARGWLVYQMTGSALALGLVTSAWGVAMVTFNLIGGALADRADKLRILAVTEISLAASSLVVTALIVTGHVQLWHLVAAAVLDGVAFGLNLPARQSLVPVLVDKEILLNAYALTMLGSNSMRVVGPAAAGMLLAPIGVGGVYGITSGLFVFSSLSRFLMGAHVRLRHQSMPGRHALAREIIDGLRFIWRHPVLPYLMALTFAVTIFAMPFMFLLPIFASDILRAGAPGLGWMMASVGLGAVVGALWLASFQGSRQFGRAPVLTALISGVFLLLFSVSRSLAPSLFLLAGVGASQIVFVAMNQTLIQNHAVDEMRGRVSAVSMMTFGFAPVGVLPITALAEATGAPLAVGAGAILVILFSVAVLAFVPRMRRL